MAGRILIVDDVATNRIVLKVKLASAFYDTIQASTGAEALRIAREVKPDLVLLDVELPDMSGIEVCEKLKADPILRDRSTGSVAPPSPAISPLSNAGAGSKTSFSVRY